MTDCPDAEMRDLLPDVVHGSLDAGARARVEAHLVTCATCRAELALLRSVHGSLSRPIALDLERIAQALPSAAAARPRATMPVQWRRAAAIAIAAIGLTALALTQSFRNTDTTSESSSVVQAEPSTPAATSPTVAVAPSPPRAPGGPLHSGGVGTPVAVRGLSLAGGVAGLEDAELEILLSELDSFDAVTEAEPVELAPNVVLGDA